MFLLLLPFMRFSSQTIISFVSYSHSSCLDSSMSDFSVVLWSLFLTNSILTQSLNTRRIDEEKMTWDLSRSLSMAKAYVWVILPLRHVSTTPEHEVNELLEPGGPRTWSSVRRITHISLSNNKLNKIHLRCSKPENDSWSWPGNWRINNQLRWIPTSITRNNAFVVLPSSNTTWLRWKWQNKGSLDNVWLDPSYI